MPFAVTIYLIRFNNYFLHNNNCYRFHTFYVCVCVYVYIDDWMHVCINVCMHACMHVFCMHAYMCMCVSVCMYVCKNVYMYGGYMHVYVCIDVCVCVCMYVCMYERIHAFIYLLHSIHCIIIMTSGCVVSHKDCFNNSS